MLDIRYVRENLEEVKKALSKKHTEFDLEGLIKLDDRRKHYLKEVERLRREKKARGDKESIESRVIRKEGIYDKGSTAELIKGQKKDLKTYEKLHRDSEEAYLEAAAKIHNIPHESVPSAEEGNKIEKTVGDKPKFDFKIKDHIELGKNLDIIDTEKAAQVSGPRFAYLKNEGALLEFALIQYLVDKLKDKNLTFMIPPVLVKDRAMWGTGFFPAEKNEFYKMGEENLYLVGTAEVPLASYHDSEIIEVPKRYVGFSSCFRREAGTYGQDTKGMIRVHQFDKMEMFCFCDPKESWKVFDEFIGINEEIFKELELPYQVVNICGGDLGAPNVKKIDIEVWIPSQEKYRELTSASNDTDFQARRLNIRFKDPAKGGSASGGKDGQTKLVHTVNDTALAMGRTIVVLLENHQQKDGSIKIPETLQKYTGFSEIK
jgi:seryl-tRNA synthetase